MIHILFLPGTFGSTINHVLKNYTVGSTITSYPVDYLLTDDGSMHLENKQGHWENQLQLKQYFNNEIDQNIKISTPIYPLPDLKAQDIINLFRVNRPRDRYIFLYVNNIADAELNMLMQYYKIAKGIFNHTVKIFCGKNEHNILNWNSNYSHWSQMQTWELREWLSLFYIEWVDEWLTAKQFVPNDWLGITNRAILDDTYHVFIEVCNFYGKLDKNKEKKLFEFSQVWRAKQQYIIDEYNLIETIVQKTLNHENFTWSKLCLISESMIQQKLRSNGYEIKCFQLNEFPTSSEKLGRLLEQL